MRKILCIVVLCFTVVFCFTSCSIPGEKPKRGVWYCEDLNMSIDFNLLPETPYCVKVYDEYGNFKVNGCLFDYSRGIRFFDDTNGESRADSMYLHSWFKYDEEKKHFIIKSKSDGQEYVFLLQSVYY